MFGVAARYVGGMDGMQDLVVKRAVIGDRRNRCRAHVENLEWAYRIEREICLENDRTSGLSWGLGEWCQRSCGSMPNR